MKKRFGLYKTYVFVVLMMVLFIFFLNYDRFERCFYPIKYSSYVEKYSSKYGVDKYLVYSIIKTESKFRKDAVSIRGASGLMQISSNTEKWAVKTLKMKDVNIFNPDVNIEIGTWYLKRLEKEFKGDLRLMITAYNGGSGNVKKWLKSKEYSRDGKCLDKIPFLETSEYTEKVLKNYKKYKKLYEK